MSDTINIMAIDPGSNMLGFSIFTISVPELEIVHIEPISINLGVTENEDALRTNLLYRLQMLNQVFINTINHYQPRIIVSEAGFINMARPAAVIPLAQAISTMQVAAYNYDPMIKFFTIPPSVIKSAVGAKHVRGGDTKIEMLKAVCKIPEITNHVDPRYFTEHVTDSIAINYTLLQTLRTDGGFLLCSI